jgi:hypothetical protein
MKAKFLWRVGIPSTSLKPAAFSIGISLSTMLSAMRVTQDREQMAEGTNKAESRVAVCQQIGM